MLFAVLVWALPATVPATAADWYVHADTKLGDDEASGSRDKPLAMIQRAVTLAEAGDTIYLLPEGALFRQTVLLNTGDDGLTIEGNDCVLSGADVLGSDGWESAGEGLWKKRVAVPRWNRFFLIVDGRPQTMGRTCATKDGTPFPLAEALQPGEFRFDPIDGDEKTGWLTVRVDVKSTELQWGTRPNGLATGGKLRGLVVRRLKARHCLNDGFNIHGDARQLVFENIEGFENFDEGFSAHDTCEAVIRDSRFFVGDHAVADVNTAETHYERCFFGTATNCSVLFQGGIHSLTDCVIEVGGTESALSISPSGGKPKDGQEIPPARLRIDGLEIRAAESRPADATGGRISLGGGTETTVVDGTELSAPGGLYVSPMAKMIKFPAEPNPQPAQ
jgi:hypothetical protein